ncbi:MAG: phosphodiester glycosidase family protein [Pedobacter sp.]|nr:MAG: phosphodiester glycosidase family protein [Pedobacter sp.]
MKKFLVIAISTLFAFLAKAQNTDSITLVKAKWNTQKIASKTYLKQVHFKDKNLFDANQFLAYVEIKRKGKAPHLMLRNEVKTKKTTSEFGKETGALVALNGTFFDIANGGSVDFIKIDGQIAQENKLSANGGRSQHQKSALTIDKKGNLTIQKWNGEAQWEQGLADPNVMVSGPLLRLQNQNEELDKSAFTQNRHPRTAVGVKQNGNIILFVVDGRHANSAGMTLPELQKTLTWLGCKEILNLDGGGSTTLWVQGFPDNGVINHPADNKNWDHAGERKVANVLLIKKRK